MALCSAYLNSYFRKLLCLALFFHAVPSCQMSQNDIGTLPHVFCQSDFDTLVQFLVSQCHSIFWQLKFSQMCAKSKSLWENCFRLVLRLRDRTAECIIIKRNKPRPGVKNSKLGNFSKMKLAFSSVMTGPHICHLSKRVIFL